MELQHKHKQESSSKKPAQRKKNNVLQDNRAQNPLQKKENNTGLPDNLKQGMENVSGVSLDHVKVHYNSPKPAAVQAHAYAQGSDIHLASGQEKHLPHELGHVVQQAKGQVNATTSVAGMPVNDNPALEKEADALGDRALQRKASSPIHSELTPSLTPNIGNFVAQQKAIVGGGAISTEILTEAMISAARQGSIPKAYYSKPGNKISNITLNGAGVNARTELLALYDRKNVRLANKLSLMYQVIQDLTLKHLNDSDEEMNGNSKHLMGLAHQHTEYTSSQNTPKSGNWHWNQEMRIYRDMPKFAWEQKKLHGHGGSIGQALHYFNRDQKTTNKHASNVYYLIEFVIPKRKTKDMVSTIKGGGEGEQTKDGKFGGKNENNTYIGETSGLFSVDLAHASDLLKSTGAISRVIASTDGIIPSYHSAPGKVWSYGKADKPEDWVG